MASNLDIFEKELEDAVVVELSGEIDISTVTELKEKLYAIVEQKNRSVKLDCTNLNYIDSTGLGVLVGVLKKVKSNNNDIYITNLKNNIKKLFLITGLNKVFIIEE
ncbi:MAG: anti-sigma factor antagonist [Petroclostridium sp.]|jgi:anti-sigma B factor antagonist|uniref:STAS domain-containing protein n=1 Tax=Petroclostridium xylanilyticum TaxID=1792311 RepID=UPI000B99D34D|nr:STAS domain-containing protein [Petroclostridium xylanilyticum]MBZ4645756.1 anti-sigma-factor antagonist [Clostridia bacterium]MDK2811538.1 anti-sigma factor antagonist [Petroclostridium sp.]